MGSIQEEHRVNKNKVEPITFFYNDLLTQSLLHNDTLVITMDIMGTDIEWVLVDTGNSVNVLYLQVFRKLKLGSDNLRLIKSPLSGLTGDMIEVEGIVELEVKLKIASICNNYEINIMVFFFFFSKTLHY